MLYPYRIWTNDGLIEKEDAELIVHIDPQSAVEEFVEVYDRRGDYYFANGHNDKTIIFVEDKDGNITEWNITVESAPRYNAMEVK